MLSVASKLIPKLEIIMRFLYLLMFFLNLILLSCKNGDINSNIPTKTISIQPFVGTPQKDVLFVINEIAKVYPHIKLQKEIPYPSNSYVPERNRYRADSLIKFLRQNTLPNQTTLGLTNLDISTTKGEVNDWGVMGLGYRPGNACIASTFRLSSSNKQMQFFKVAIHELGHTEGLDHCEVKSCFMRDAEGRNPTDEEIDFCKNCKPKLIKRGWNF